MVSLTLILATSQYVLPQFNLDDGATWKQRVEQVTKFNPPDRFEEKMVFEETVKFDGDGVGYTLVQSRTLLEHVIEGQKIPVPEKPSPSVFTEYHSFRDWPILKTEIEDPYTVRLRRATTYVPITRIDLPAKDERRLPAALYEGRESGGTVYTVFREKGGLTAHGTWKFDDKGRILVAKIVCEKAFAPGGDGTAATFTVTITGLKT